MAVVSTGSSAAAPNKPAWLSLMEQISKEDEPQPHEERLMDALRHMFEASGNDESLARTAARHIPSIFYDSLSGSEPIFDQESLVLFYIDTFEAIVFELAKAISFPSIEHRRLTSFILQLQDLTNQLFEAPDGASCLQALQRGLDEGAKASWSSSELTHKGASLINNDPALYSHQCSGHLSLGALFAQLYQGGLLSHYGSMFVSSEMHHVFGLDGKRPLTAVFDIKAAAYRRELACQEILLAGERLSQETKAPGEIHKITTEQWKTWATEFEKLAASIDEDPIGYKDHAREAHAKMVALLPELFEKK